MTGTRWIRRHRAKLIALGLVILIIGAAYGFRHPLLGGLGAYVVINEEPIQADLIAVMHAEWWEVAYGLDLYREGYAPRVLFVGSDPKELAVTHGDGFRVEARPWNEIVRGIARAEGIPDEAVLTSPRQTDSTYEQTRMVVSLARAEDARSVLIVSDPIHMRRIAWSADRLLGETTVDFTYTPVPAEFYPPDRRYDPDRWWRDEFSTKVLFAEYVKLGFYLLNY